jgi:Tfp pilus assembly protein PilF
VSAEALAAGLADPKDKLWEFNSILKAGDAFRVSDFSTGEQLLLQVRSKDPQVSAIPYMLGEAALRQHNWDAAVNELQMALTIDPTFDQAMTALARAFHEKGDDDSARQWLDKALHRNEQNFRAWYELGWIDSKSGNNDAAEASYQKVLALQPNFPLAERDLGMLYFGKKDYQKAAAHLARATELGVREAQLFNFLGISYSLIGRLPVAVRSYQQALQIDPSLADAHLNLGYAYEQLKQAAAAAEQYREACRLKSELCNLIHSRGH